MPKESSWYRYYVANFLLYDVDSPMAKSFVQDSGFLSPNILSLSNKLKQMTDSIDGVASNSLSKPLHSLSFWFLDPCFISAMVGRLMILRRIRQYHRRFTAPFFIFSSSLEAPFYMTSLCRLLCIWVRQS
jgi:hypothetical protein